MKSAEIQDQINQIDAQIQEGASDAQLNVWEMQKSDLKKEFETAQAEEMQNQQAHDVRIQEATEESENILDDIEIAGVPIAESGLSELAFSILKAKVQAKYVAKVETLLQEMSEQRTQHQTEIKMIVSRAEASESMVEVLQTTNKTLEVDNYQLGIENNELNEKVRKSADLLDSATQTIEQQSQWLDDFRKKELLGERAAQRVVPSSSEQIRLQEEALKASRIKVTKLELSHPEDYNTRDWFVILASTGEKVQINYLEKGKYTLVTEEEAAQYRAEVEQKKADEAAQSEAIPVNEMQVEPVSEVEAPAEEKPFQENHQVDTQDSGTDTQGERNGTLDEVVGQPESEVITLESLKAELEALKTAHDTTVVRVGNIERHANIQAVA